jgi:hypothetical protein
MTRQCRETELEGRGVSDDDHAQMTRLAWYFTAEGRLLGSHNPGMPFPEWFTAHLEADFWVFHPGFPGVSETDGEPTVHPPVPGRDFTWMSALTFDVDAL